MTTPLSTYAHDGLNFDLDDSGPAEGRCVLLLHGFPEDRHCWLELSRSLNEAGYRTLAPRPEAAASSKDLS